MLKKLVDIFFEGEEESTLKLYWFCICITAISCFGFAITHSSMGIDDEWLPLLSRLNVIFLNENRIGIFLTSKLVRTMEYLPFWREIIAVCLYIIGITLHVDNFLKYLPIQKFDKNSAIIFSTLAISFPYIAFNFIFMYTVIEQPLTIIFSALATNYTAKYFLSDKNKKYLIYSFIFMTLVFSFYETGIMYYFLSSIFLILFTEIYADENKTETSKLQNPFKWVFSLGIISLFSIILNYTIIFIYKNLAHYNYIHNKYAQFFMYNTDSFSSFISSFIKNNAQSFNDFLRTCSYDVGSFIILISNIILVLLLLYLFFNSRNKKILYFGILFMLLPILPPLSSGHVDLMYRTIVSYGFFVPLVFVLLYSLIKENKYLKYSFFIFIFLCVFYQTKEINQIFYTEYLKCQNDKMFAFNVANDIKKINDKPVIFVGVRENPKLKHEYYIEAAEVNISIFNWDRYDDKLMEVFVQRPYYFIREQGIDIKSFFEDKYLDDDSFNFYIDLISKETKKMTVYPQNGSVKELDEFILVKIGQSRFDE